MNAAASSMPLKEQLNQLVQLQELDLKIDQINKQKNGLPGVLKNLDQQLATLKKQSVDQSTALEEIQKKERQTREAMNMTKDRETRAQEKLSAVGNTTEYNAASKEIDQLKKQYLELNAQAEALGAEVKTGTGKVEAIQSQMKEIQAKRDEEASKISGETSQLEGQANELVAQRAQFLPQIEKRILMNYDRVRGARAGIGISPALGGRCGVCNMAVPPQMYIELQKGRDLHSCPSCHRILYVK